MKTSTRLLSIFFALLMVILSVGNPAAEADETVKIKLWAHSFEDWADNLLQEQVNEFNKTNTEGIQITVQFYGDDSTYDTAIAAGMENETVADIFMAQYDRIYTYLNAGYIAPVDPWLTEEEKDGYLDAVRDSVTFVDPADGIEKMYALPFYYEPTMMLFYDKGIFEKAGIDTVPETTAELLAACEKIIPLMDARRNQFAIVIPTNSIELTWTTIGLVQSFTGDQAVDAATWTVNRVKTHEGEFAQLARVFYDLAKMGACPLASLTPEGYFDTIDAVCEGKAAMALCGSWAVGRLMNYYPDMVDEIGVAQMPGKDNNIGTADNGGWTYIISAQSDEEKQEKAMTFLKWYLCQRENACQYFEGAFYSKAATRKDVIEYIEEHAAESVNPEWIKCVNTAAAQGGTTFAASWSIKVQIGSLLEYMLNHASDNKPFEALFAEKISEVEYTIDSILAQPGYFTNPKAK